MKPSSRFLGFLLIGILLLACENEQQAWLSEMEGIPECTVPAIIGKNLPVTITTGGITTPGNVAYTWNAPNFTPSTFTGTTLEALAPAVVGEHYILITAHSAGYRDVSKKYKITVVDCVPMTGRLDIAAPADMIKEENVQFHAMGITSPVEGNVTYEWYAPSFSPESYTGDARFETRAPRESRTYTITVVAKAENYCDTTIQKMILVKPGRKMQGLFDFTSFPPIIKGQNVTFAAHGITTPTAEHISYEWRAPDFTAGAMSGNSYTAICPPATGTYEVAVTAKATGYTDSTVRREITVTDELPMSGNISITVPPEVIVSLPATFYVTNGITIPAEGISFVWDAPYFTPSTFQSTGNTFTATAPPGEGPYNITVTARAANYSGAVAQETVNVKGALDMSGSLDFNVPSQIVKDLEAVFSVNSTLTADESSITYEWDAPGFSAITFGGPTFTGIPSTAGSHTITLRASAKGYTPRVATKTVDVIAGLDMGELTISAQGGSSNSFDAGKTVIFIPNLAPSISNATYTWSAPGCTPDSFTGAQYNLTLPPTEGPYTVTLTASATGYHSKQAIYGYTIICNKMPVSFNLTRTALLTGDETTLSVNPSVNSASYTWDIPTGFGTTAGSSVTPQVTIKAPSNALANPATITLQAKAVNYCDASHTATVTVKDCYPFPTLPTITANLGESNGFVIVPSRRNVTFSTPAVTPLRAGGTATYNWSFMSSSYPFNPSGLSGSNNEFTTVAPGFNAETYTLNLQVKADGYCDLDPTTQQVAIAPYTEQLQGKIILDEAITPENTNDDPVVWIAKGHTVTLHASYLPSAQEDNLDAVFSWEWMDNNGARHSVTSKDSDKGVLEITPSSDVSGKWIIVKVTDNNGRAPISKEFRYTVQDCVYRGSDLHVNVNYKCDKTATAYNSTVYIKDAADSRIYRVVNINQRWWFGENLRRATGSYQQSSSTVTGLFYERDNNTLADMANSSKGTPCPVGWKIPSSSDWNDLAVIHTTNTEQFKLLANSQKTTDLNNLDGTVWVTYQNTPYTNIYEFSALPGGYLSGSGSQSLQGRAAYFMTHDTNVWYLGNTSGAGPSSLFGTLGSTPATNGDYYNIRCVRDYP
ncbi:MAG: hypothetical protein LBD52_00115 [Prevotellaceae bacterium]|jgi:uncharacterized protein (TIGR02145 family)|nr:hypothetical protein [Prevotellaceae bacterium]